MKENRGRGEGESPRHSDFVRIAFVLKPGARSPEGKKQLANRSRELGFDPVSSGLAASTFRISREAFAKVFGSPPREIPAQAPGERDFGAPAGMIAGELPVPEELSEWVSAVSVEPPARRLGNSPQSASRTSGSERVRTEAEGPRVQVGGGSSATVKIAGTLHHPGEGIGPAKFGGKLTPELVRRLAPPPEVARRAIRELNRLGLKFVRQGRLSFSIRADLDHFERVFEAKLKRHKMDSKLNGISAQEEFWSHHPDAALETHPRLKGLFDSFAVQHPHTFMQQVSAQPPAVNHHHLRVPSDVSRLLNADRIHSAGGTGEGVKVAMIDSGFAHGHPYFADRGYRTQTILAHGATDPEADGVGHGTGESANLLAVAPGVEFVGIKLSHEVETHMSASLLEGLHEALNHDPQIISISLGFDLVPTDSETGTRTSDRHLTSLPANLKALEAEIQAIVAEGKIVVFSAGNGHVAFPAMMEEVIAAGGVYVGADGSMRASDYASAFESKIYADRRVPDFCGLVGLAENSASYILLPVEASSQMDVGFAPIDGTADSDGWAVFSGTSAAAPQLAGVCALLLQKNPGLTPSDVKTVLAETCLDVVEGEASAASNEGVAMTAAVGPDGATGGGLVDAFAAWQRV